MSRYAPKPWVHPSNYAGTTWNGWLCFLSRNRDSGLLDNHNFETASELQRFFPIDLTLTR